MGLLSKLRGEPAKETPCPRCGVPAPDGVTECHACGWDLRESYEGDPGAPADSAAERERTG